VNHGRRPIRRLLDDHNHLIKQEDRVKLAMGIQ
jgi:hypothetical protein